MIKNKKVLENRAFVAVIKDKSILMVRHKHGNMDYWTLPRGGIEANETPEKCGIREVKEETGLSIKIVKRLFKIGNEICLLGALINDAKPVVGSDPELLPEKQIIKDVKWFSLKDKADDLQVKPVLAVLKGKDLKEKNIWKNKITAIKSKAKNIRLVKPDINYKKAYLEFVREYEKKGERKIQFVISQNPLPFDLYIKKLTNWSKGIDVKPGFVAHSTFWLMRNNKILGVVNIRHKLNKKLKKKGGHIGYSIRPSERKKGYGILLLNLALKKAKQLGLKKVLLRRCNKINATFQLFYITKIILVKLYNSI